MPVPYCFNYSNFVVYFETRIYMLPFLSFLRIALTIQGLICFYRNFRIIFSFHVKSVLGILIKIVLNLQSGLSMDI